MNEPFAFTTPFPPKTTLELLASADQKECITSTYGPYRWRIQQEEFEKTYWVSLENLQTGNTELGFSLKLLNKTSSGQNVEITQIEGNLYRVCNFVDVVDSYCCYQPNDYTRQVRLYNVKYLFKEVLKARIASDE